MDLQAPIMSTICVRNHKRNFEHLLSFDRQIYIKCESTTNNLKVRIRMTGLSRVCFATDRRHFVCFKCLRECAANDRFSNKASFFTTHDFTTSLCTLQVTVKFLKLFCHLIKKWRHMLTQSSWRHSMLSAFDDCKLKNATGSTYETVHKETQQNASWK